jgi:hypothetical protein
LKYLERILGVAEKWLSLGQATLDDGTRLIGRVEPDAYLHVFFPGLVGGEFEAMEMFVRRPVPKPLRDLYQRFNGFSLFRGELDLFGLRRSHTRTSRDVYQPFAIQTPNVDERPPRTPEDIVFFGFYQDDGCEISISPRSPEVYATPMGKWKVERTWPDLETCLVSEVERLAALFDKQGRMTRERGKISPVAK